MATLKQIRRRIRSVQSTQQITKAMEMVAAAKLKRAQDRVLASRPYAVRISAMLQSLAGSAQNLAHPLFETRPVQRRVVVVLASDKGLCGSYNMNVFRGTERQFAGMASVSLVPGGRRAQQYFSRRHWPMPFVLPEMGDQANQARAKELALVLIRMYVGRETDQIDLAYTQFISTMQRRFVIEPLLPITGLAPAGTGGDAAASEGTNYIFEPSPEAIFSTLLPKYVENRVLQAIAESLASEHSARMVSMGAATKNASDVIDHLTLVRNRLRQAAITREISEIVGGADALK